MSRKASTSVPVQHAGIVIRGSTAADLFTQTAYWFLPRQLQHLRRVLDEKGRGEVKRIAMAASAWSDREPLHMVTRRFDIEGYESDLRGAQVTAIMVAALWILCGEKETAAAALVEAWPGLPAFAQMSAEIEGQI